MELLWILGVWIGSWYLIKLHRELYIYKKYLNQHNDIYVPSYDELLEMNHLRFRLLNLILLQFKNESTNKSKSMRPGYNKGLAPSSVYSKE